MISIRDTNKYYHTGFILDTDLYRLWKTGGYGKIYINKYNRCVIKRLERYCSYHETDKDKNDVSYCSIYSCMIQEAAFSRKLTIFPHFLSLRSIQLCPSYIYIVQDFMGHSFHRLPETILQNTNLLNDMIFRMIRACFILYKNGIQHIDLKPSNVLYNTDTNAVTVIDYNSMSVTYINDLQEHVWTDGIGTWMYAAPEIILEGKIYKNTSVWAIGMIICHLLGIYPLQKKYYPNSIADTVHHLERSDFQRIIVSIFEEEEILFESSLSSVDPKYTYILSRIFKKEPQDRISIEKLYYLWAITFQLKPSMDIDMLYHEVMVKPYTGYEPSTRKKLIEITYNFCVQQNQLYKFCNMIHIFDHFSSHITVSNELKIIFASWILITCIMNEELFQYIPTLEHIEQTYQVYTYEITDIVWIIGDYLEWNLYEKPVDVWLHEHGKTIDYNLIKDTFIHIHYKYSMKLLYEKITHSV
jgi:hypothetical protein